jgi:mannose-6-phosphate isomerase-like protein (cupin superfamily)
MRRLESFFLLILAVCVFCCIALLLYFLATGDVATSVVPGWHTVIFPPVTTIVLLLIFLNSLFIIYIGTKTTIRVGKAIFERARISNAQQHEYKVNLNQKFSKFTEHWHPYIIGELNDNFVKIAKVKGDLVWHKHEHEDELFVVLSGTLMMDFRDGTTIATKPGEILIVPKNTEHRPWTNDEEVKLMLVEPKATKHTGELVVKQTVTNLEWI